MFEELFGTVVVLQPKNRWPFLKTFIFSTYIQSNIFASSDEYVKIEPMLESELSAKRRNLIIFDLLASLLLK